MTQTQERWIHLDRESAAFLDYLKERRHLATDKEALQFCIAEAALTISTPEDRADDDDPRPAEVLAHALAYPETLTPLDAAFAMLRQELETDQPGTYEHCMPERTAA